MTPLASLLVAGCLALVGYAAGWLTRGGAIAATLIGGVVLAEVGIIGIALLALFFVSGSMLTYGRRRTRTGRTWRQVFANGGWAALGAVVAATTAGFGWAIFTGALAAAQADTWGTEIGSRARQLPRLITTRQPVPTGTSGGITALGTGAGVVGAGLMGSLAWALGLPPEIALAGAVGGVVGTLGDSLIGATLQGTYYCDACRSHTEQPTHRCGRTATLVRGWRWIDNDMVNLLATGLGAATALGIAMIL